MGERWYCLFYSSFRYESAPNISHETIDKVRTLCGRKVADAQTLESDDNNLEPDCSRCRKALARMRKAKADAEQEESALLCEDCSPGHRPGELRKPCGHHACECWCNRSTAAPVDNTTGPTSRS